jgi:hypothetical protein
MKVKEAIAEADGLKANMLPLEQKIKWLNRLDLTVKQEILDTHEYNTGETEPATPAYTKDNMETELLVPEPFAEMYVHWLEAQIDYANLENEGFNAANAMFESVYSKYRNYYNQHHRPKSARKIYY